MRERLADVPVYLVQMGITPACAGKTSVFIWRLDIAQDHPRVCGKDFAVITFIAGLVGSPPRVRERLVGYLISAECPRITPACAGKTFSFLVTMLLIRDHPRVCGKDNIRSLPDLVKEGSPPRVRERRIGNFLIISSPGITPACAGKTRLGFLLLYLL